MRVINKKLCIILAVICMIFGLSATVEAAETSGTCGDKITWKLENGVLRVTGTGPMYNYDEAWSNTATNISPIHQCIEEAKDIIISDGITTIGNSVFFGCKNCTSITIPTSITSIGDYAFLHCESLPSISIPNSVRDLGKNAFGGCYSLTSVTVPKSLVNIGYSPFFNGVHIEKVVFEEGTTFIGEDMFGSSIWADNAVVIVPDTVISIGDEAFRQAYGLSKINLPNSVTSIGEMAFAACVNLQSISLPNNLKEISAGTFAGSGLKEITFPESIRKIGKNAFVPYEGKGLEYSDITKVTFEGTSVEISDDSFSHVGEKEPATLIVPSGWQGTLPESETEKWHGGYFKVIKKTASIVSIAPTAKTLTYNGQAQELVTAGTASNGTMQYALGTNATTMPTGGWSTSIPTATDAGTYYVWYMAVGDNNHNDSAAAFIIVTVSKANSTVTTAPTGKKLTYSGQTQELLTAGTANGGNLVYALGTVSEATQLYTTSIPSAVNAGTYYVWYKVVGDKNHTDSAPACVTVKITDKTETEKPTEPVPVPIKVPMTKDAFTGVTETVSITGNGAAVVKSVASNGGNTLKLTGTVKHNGTTYSVSKFAAKSFRNVDSKNIVIDLKTSGNTQRVTFMPKAFKGSDAKKLSLNLISSSQVKFKSGAMSGSKIKKVLIYGLDNTQFRKVQKNLRSSGYKGKIVKK